MATKENITNISQISHLTQHAVPLVYEIEGGKLRSAGSTNKAIELIRSRIDADREKQSAIVNNAGIQWTRGNPNIHVGSQTVARDTPISRAATSLTNVTQTSNWRIIAPPYNEQTDVPANLNAYANKVNGNIWAFDIKPLTINLGVAVNLRSPKRTGVSLTPEGDFTLFVSNLSNDILSRFQQSLFAIQYYVLKAVPGGWEDIVGLSSVVLDLATVNQPSIGLAGQMVDLVTGDPVHGFYDLFPIKFIMEPNTDYQAWVFLSQGITADLNGGPPLRTQFDCRIPYFFLSTTPL